jgi:polysaccharide pyruvyl transferase WcaK-like protein
MRILVDVSSPDLTNVGDVAMLQVAVARLRELWPDSLIQVLTDAPERLRVFCPTAIPIPGIGQRQWYGNRRVVARMYRLLPSPVARIVGAAEERLWLRWPALSEAVIRAKLRHAGLDGRDVTQFLGALGRADLVVASGGGFVTDTFRAHALRVLSTLQAAVVRGVPTAMLGQGFGPIANAELRECVRAVLPRVQLISLRESRASQPLLSELGVPLQNVLTTGDDAIELAWLRRTPTAGAGIGVNLRVTPYSGVGPDTVAVLGPVLRSVSERFRAPLLPVPISHHPTRSDMSSIDQLLGSGSYARSHRSLDTPTDVITQIAQCRLVITGSYHAAVFALAQGIPAVGLARSEYYMNKFLGLATQFGSGCAVISLDDRHLPSRLAGATLELWDSAERVRPQLLRSAERQVALSRAAYRRVEVIARHQAAA